jgi:hypothetical protein
VMPSIGLVVRQSVFGDYFNEIVLGHRFYS